jgi:hypothetical protein
MVFEMGFSIKRVCLIWWQLCTFVMGKSWSYNIYYIHCMYKSGNCTKMFVSKFFRNFIGILLIWIIKPNQFIFQIVVINVNVFFLDDQHLILQFLA